MTVTVFFPLMESQFPQYSFCEKPEACSMAIGLRAFKELVKDVGHEQE